MRRKTDLAIALNYYHPHVSGLSEAARIWAEEAARNGLTVTVVCCRHDSSLPKRSSLNGVTIVRAPILCKFRNGLISPLFPFIAIFHLFRSKVSNLHLPMLEAGFISLFIQKSRLISVYQCDYVGPSNRLGKLIETVLDFSNKIALRRSAVKVVSSFDYSTHSRIAQSLNSAIEMHPPFINRSKGNPTFRDGEGFHYGFVGRISKEKGIDLLIQSFQDCAEANDRLLIAGKGEIGLGESVIELIRSMASTDNRIELLGFVEEERMNDYFASIDVLVFPSINMLEAFGIVQLEAISAGIPVIASDLPGVRTVIKNSGYGLLSKPGDVNDLTRAMIAIKSFEANGVTPPSNSLDQYCSLISNMCG